MDNSSSALCLLIISYFFQSGLAALSSTEKLLADVDVESFKSFRASLEKKLRMKTNSLNKRDFKEYYKSYVASGSVLSGDTHTRITNTTLLASMLCALCQQQNNISCIERFCMKSEK